MTISTIVVDTVTAIAVIVAMKLDLKSWWLIDSYNQSINCAHYEIIARIKKLFLTLKSIL